MISTRGRYALRVLIDLAEHDSGDYIPMKEIAARQGLSRKYLEQIMPILMKDNLVDGMAGQGGGYRLNRPAEEYVVGHILRLTEGDLAPVACLGCEAERCDRADNCKTLPMWEKLDKLIDDYLEGITLKELTHVPDGGDFVI